MPLNEAPNAGEMEHKHSLLVKLLLPLLEPVFSVLKVIMNLVLVPTQCARRCSSTEIDMIFYIFVLVSSKHQTTALVS